MGVPFWVDDAEYWNEIYIADFYFDETDIEIEGDLENDIDVPKASGNDGARATNKGYVPCKVKISVVLYKPEHWDQYQAFLMYAAPRPGKTPMPVVAVRHPKLELYKKDKFQLAKLPWIKDLPKNQKLAVWELIEWFPEPKKAPKRTKREREPLQMEQLGSGKKSPKRPNDGQEPERPSRTATRP